MTASKILIVEDESIIAEDMKQSLTELGYHIPAVAYSGMEAIKNVEQFEPDVVLMDIVMPGEMDGIEAASEIRSKYNVPVIFVTAYADDTLLKRAKVAQPYGYILKPFVQRELHTNIEMALYKHKAENELWKKQRQLETTLAELAEAQERIIQQERLAAVGHLSAGIAHDFNNIMASIILNADMVLRNDSVVGKDRDRISTIRTQGKHAADLTQKMLDFCGMSVLHKRVVDLNQFIEAFCLEIIASLPDNIKVGIESNGEDVITRIDPDRLQQAFHNIIANARDAMPKGGEIIIKLDKVATGSAENKKEMICVTISDTGEGIPASIRPHIFEPFFTTRSPLRTGLGLSQAHGIIKQHGGRIEVDSSVGKGSSIMVYLPALDSPNFDCRLRSDTDIVLGEGQTILVVISDQALRDALISSLEMLNYRVFGAGSERSALEILENEKDSIDLVLSDLSVSAFQGLETLQTIKRLGPETRIVFLAGLDFIEEISRLGMGETVFGLEKPIDLEELAQGIAQAFM
ncbi:MAG: response regulator [Anaerolineales bacterium]|nr:response regulator [Anaerolineales bacterium]